MTSVTRNSSPARRRIVPPSWPALVAAVVLFGIYVLCDLREGGRGQTLTTTRLSTAPKYDTFFGSWFLAGMFVLDALLALVAGQLLVMSWRMLRERRRARREGSVAACSTGATLALGFFTFACPGCPLPILGSLGVTFFATSLPLYGLEFKLAALILTVGTYLWIKHRAPMATRVQDGVVTSTT